jgi:hypothetical protein
MLTNQPLYPALPDTAHPALARVSASIIAAGDASGWARNAGIGIGPPALNGAIASGTTVLGNALAFDGASTYLSYGAANIPAAEFTVLFGGIFDSFDNYRGIADCTVNGASGWNIFQAAGGGLWFSVNGYAGSLFSSGWPTGTVVHGALRNKNGATCDWFRDGVNIASTSGKNPGAVTNPLWIGNQRGSGLPFLSGRFAYFHLLDKYLDDLSIAAIAANPWQLFEPEGEDIWVPSPALDLAGAAVIQKSSVTGAAIAQAQSLASAASIQAHMVTAAAVAQNHVLAVAASTQKSAATAAALVQVQPLASAASVQAQAASAAAISRGLVLLQFESLQENAAFAAAITQEHLLAVPARSIQDNASSNIGAMLFTHLLAGANPDQANASGIAEITGTQLLRAVSSRQFNSSAKEAMGDGMIEPALATARAQPIRVKKPGIPAGTPEWLKTMMEILTGRRGNRIAAPQFRKLTFSATPTQSECEALYSYTNTVRDALEQVISRMDG